MFSLVLAGLERDTQTKYLNGARQYFQWYYVEYGELCEHTFSIEPVVYYTLDMFEAGYGVGKVVNTLQGLEAITIMLGIFKRWTKDPVMSLVLGRWSRGDKKRKNNRHFISREQFLYLLDHPPLGVDPECWKLFCSISWVFALRHSEMRAVQPKHLEYVPSYGKEGPTFSCFVANPKTAKGQNQTVYMPLSTIPQDIIPLLHSFVDANHSIVWNWNSIIPKKLVNPCLRDALRLDNPECLVHHSFRHGRACDLFHVCGYKLLSELMQAGRWRSKGAALVYIHAKVNWEAPDSKMPDVE